MANWKPIKGYEGLYEINDEGQVFSLKHCKILKGSINSTGYIQVTMPGRRALVHRLVAEAFIPNPNNYPVINHIDSNPKNNHVSNLEWCNQSHNQLHSVYNNGGCRTGSKNYRSTIDENKAFSIFNLLKTMSVRETAKVEGVTIGIVYKIKKGEAWNQVTGLPRVRHNKFYKQNKAA